MLSWLQKMKEWNRETRLFYITVFIYVAAVVIPVVYCYVRLDFVRSYDTSSQAIENQTITT